MNSSVPSWKVELQRRKKEKLMKESENDKSSGKLPWKNDFNEPVNVIIISAKDGDLETENDNHSNEDPFTNHQEDFLHASDNRTNCVSEEHVSSVKNNPFLRFDQMVSSKNDTASPRSRNFRRQSSGSITHQLDDEVSNGEPSNLKSRSKSVENLNFRLQSNIPVEDDEVDGGIGQHKTHGKGIIASLRAKFGKPASVDEFLAIVKRPRSRSHTSHKEAQTSRKISDSASGPSRARIDQENPNPPKTKSIVESDDKPDFMAPSNSRSSQIQGTLSEIESLSDRSMPEQKVDADLKGEKEIIHPVVTASEVAQKKSSNLSASALIMLNNEDSGTGKIPKRPPSVVDGGEDFFSAVSKPEGDDFNISKPKIGGTITGKNHEDKDQTMLPKTATINENHIKSGTDVQSEPVVVSSIAKTDIKRTDSDVLPKESVSGRTVSDVSKKSDHPGLVKKLAVVKGNHQQGGVSNKAPKQTTTTSNESIHDNAIKTTTINFVPSHAETVKRTTITTVEKLQKKKDTEKIPAKQEEQGTLPASSKADSTGKEQLVELETSTSHRTVPANHLGDDDQPKASPFAVKLRKVEKPPSAKVKIVRSSKGKEANKKVVKQDVQTRLKQQVNGEIPVTNIDDVDLNEVKGQQQHVIEKVNFEVIGFNSRTNSPSLLLKRRNKKLRLQFNDSIQTYEYQSEESALKEYILQHGDEPEEEVIRVSENIDDDDDDEDDIDKETKKKTINNNTSLYAEGLQNITKSNNTDLSAFLGRGPHKKEPDRPAARPPPFSVTPTEREPEMLATPLDNGDGFSVGSSSAMLF